MRATVQILDGSKRVNMNRRKAIRIKCLDCSGQFPKDVKNCEFKNCGLYPFRMGTGRQDAQKRHKAIRDHCFDCCAGNQFEVYECPAKDCSLYPFRKVKIDRQIKF